MFTRALLFFFTSLTLCSQAQKALTKAELLNRVAHPISDTLLLDAYNELIWPIYSYENADSSIYYAEKAIALAKKCVDIERLSIAYRRVGITYINMGETKKALIHQEESYRLSELIDYKKGMQLALNNIGVVYLNNELYNKALSYFLRSLKLVEELKDFSSVSQLYSNCAMIYRRTDDNIKSRNFFLKAKYYARLKNDTNAVINVNCNLSTVHRNLKNLDSALYYSQAAKTLMQENSPFPTKYNFYLTNGLLESYVNNHTEALKSFSLCIPFVTSQNDEVTLFINIAEEYKKLNQPENMLRYFTQAYEISQKNNMYNNLQYLSYAIATYYKTKGDSKTNNYWLDLHLNYRDSNDKHTRVQQIFQQQLEFDFERKQVADSLRFEQKEKLKNIELEVSAEKLAEEKSLKLMFLVLLILIAVFSIFSYNRFIVTKKQNVIIQKQKRIVETKNTEIVDSINYAKRLQEAILPQLKDIQKVIDFDVLYLPKDIIGGDFYFFEKRGSELFIAVCDCTGHGIPGALMSVVCHEALRKSIQEFNLSEPDQILQKTREIIIESLHAGNQKIRDGMDCSLLAINTTTSTLKWSGAFNPLWILEGQSLSEIKPDKQPVALYEGLGPFTKHEFAIKKGMLLYLFTDGFADQFGGPKGKKFKLRQLKETMISLSKASPNEHIQQLSTLFSFWKNDLDQVDDVTIAVLKF